MWYDVFNMHTLVYHEFVEYTFMENDETIIGRWVGS